MVHVIYANRRMECTPTPQTWYSEQICDLCGMIEMFNIHKFRFDLTVSTVIGITRFLHQRWRWFHFAMLVCCCRQWFLFAEHRKSIGYQSPNRIKWSISISGDIKLSISVALEFGLRRSCLAKVFFFCVCVYALICSLFLSKSFIHFRPHLCFFVRFCLFSFSIFDFYHCWLLLKIPFS